MHALGQRTVAALDAFNRSSSGLALNDIFEQFFHIGPDRATFDRAQSFVNALFRSLPVKPIALVSDSLKEGDPSDLSSKRIVMSLGQMFPSENSAKHISYNTIALEMTHDAIYFRRRALPGRWSSHLDERLPQRAGEAFSYEGRDFLNAVPFVLALARVLEPQVGAKFLPDGIPVAVPHGKGLFLGAVKRALSNRFHNQDMVYLRAGEKNLPPVEWDRLRWIPTVDVDVQTFIGMADFSPNQAKLHKLLLPYTEDDLCTVLSSGVDLYNDGHHPSRLSRAMHESLDAVHQRLAHLIASPDWQNAVRVPAIIPGFRPRPFLR